MLKNIITTIVFICIGLTGFCQQKGFQLTGNFKGLVEGEKVALSLIEFNRNNNWDVIKVDSVYVKNGEFSFSGNIPEGPRHYQVKVQKRNFPLFIKNGDRCSVTLINDININDVRFVALDGYIEVQGSPSASAALKLNLAQQVYKDNIGRINNYLQSVQDSIGFQPQIIESMIRAKQMLSESFFLNLIRNTDPSLAPARLVFMDAFHSWNYGQHSSVLMKFYKIATEEEKNSYWGQWLNRWAPLCVGQVFPDFSLPNTEGKIVKLKDIVSKSKMTIVHFWASNSTKSREENEKLLAILYKKYMDKGLSIIGISADTKADMWNGYLKDHTEQAKWHQVSDLKGNLPGNGGIINDVYLEGGHREPNTTNVLLDQKGQIVSWLDADNKHSSAEIQYYLWKQFGY